MTPPTAEEVDALAPCPFCGSANVIHVTADHPKHAHYVLCMMCDSPSAMRDTKEKAAESWNLRAHDAERAKPAEPIDVFNGVLPCPFCGCNGVNIEQGSNFRWRLVQCAGCGAQSGEVRCQTLGDGTKEEWEAQAEQDAFAEWNTRAKSADETVEAKERKGYAEHLIACGIAKPAAVTVADEMATRAWQIVIDNCDDWDRPTIEGVRLALATAQVGVPDGCTQTDIDVLRKANVDLATQSHELAEALGMYARGEHFQLIDPFVWDTVSGEPQNWWCDNEGTATVEDGTIAKQALTARGLDDYLNTPSDPDLLDDAAAPKPEGPQT